MESRNLVKSGSEGESLIKGLFSKVLPYWPLFAAFLVVGLIVARIYLKFSTPIYEASASIIILDQTKGNEESKLTESLDLISSKKIVENEIEVIQSRRVMKNVADRMNLYASIEEKTGFGLRSGYYSFPISVQTPNPEMIKGLAKDEENPVISYDSSKKVVSFNNREQYPLNKIVKTKYGPLLFTENKNYVPAEDEKDNKFVLTIARPQELIPRLLKRLSISETGKLSSVIGLLYRDEVPKRAEEVLNQIIFSYREAELEEKDSLAKNTIEFIDERLAKITRDLDSIQLEVQSYKSGKNAVDIGTQGQLYLQNVSNNDQQLSEVNNQISVLSQLEGFLKTNQTGGTVPSAVGLNDPVLTDMLTKLNALGLDYERGRTTIGENNPKILEIRDQINKLKPDILRNVTGQKQILISKRDNLNQTNRTYNAMLSQVPLKERQLIDITRAEQSKNDIYNFLLQKKEESQIAYLSTMANNKVVDYAKASLYPVSPKGNIVYLGTIILMLCLPLGLVTLKETFNSKVLYRKEIEELTHIPIIGEISNNKLNRQIIISAGTRNLLAEQFRKLRLYLTYPGRKKVIKKILVTSNISGEGKSFIAANLGISLTLTNKRVVIVDMDLNNPTQESKFRIKNPAGVADYLAGKCTLDNIIKPVPEHENLYLVSAGSLPNNPTELLSDNKTRELIEFLSESFDYVVIDTSPIGLVTDGYLLTQLCDITLFAVRHQFTPKILIKRLSESNKITPIHNPAIIFNGVKQRGQLSSYYGYGYGYDYVYGKNNIYG